MLTNKKKSKQISELVIGLELIDRTLTNTRNELSGDPLTPKQIDLVGILIRNPEGLAIKEIAKRLNVSSSAVVQIIDSFDSDDFISRKSVSNDKRKSIAFISNSGQKYIKDNLVPYTCKYDENIFGVLNDTEFKEFTRLTKKIANFIEPVVKNGK